MIRAIKARGHMVEILSDENGSELINRKEALHRAKAIIGIDQDSPWLVEALIKAANQAKQNDPDDGKPYDSESMELLMKTASDQSAKIK